MTGYGERRLCQIRIEGEINVLLPILTYLHSLVRTKFSTYPLQPSFLKIANLECVRIFQSHCEFFFFSPNHLIIGHTTKTINHHIFTAITALGIL